ncbi:transporter substrate-binding domain-containing protein [Mesorhizobium sp. M0923]|uniref:transporter substrate-binding domain-containing protein n=1 Tax=Mesorhizobium sp. M0923 TaxID=2957028 RepID=UPI003335C338
MTAAFKAFDHMGVAANTKITVATCGGCITEKNMMKAGISRGNILAVDNEQSAIKMVQAGRVDAYVYPTLSVVALLGKVNDPSLEMVSPIKDEPVNCAGAAFRKSDSALRDAYDAAFDQLKASGEFDKISASAAFRPTWPSRPSGGAG